MTFNNPETFIILRLRTNAI